VFVLKANLFDSSQAPQGLEGSLQGRGEHLCRNSAAAFGLAGSVSPTDVCIEGVLGGDPLFPLLSGV